MITDLKKEDVEIFKDIEQSKKLWLQFKKHHVRQLRTKRVLLEQKQLGFHGLGYFSPLKACFTFEIESLDMVTHLSPVLFRDGVLGLAEFFYKNPHPQKKTQILVHKNLTFLIPNAWKDHCFAYEYQSSQQSELKHASSLILGNSGFGQRQGADLSFELLKVLIEKSKITFNEVWISNFPTFPKETLRKDIDLQNEQIALAVKIAKFFPHPVVVKTPYQIEKEKISSSIFWDLNGYQFYYSDSFFYQSLLAGGSRPLYTSSDANQWETIDELNLSFFHKIVIYQISENKVGKIEAELNQLQNTSLFHQDPVKDDDKDTLPPKPIAEIIFNLIQKRYTP